MNFADLTAPAHTSAMTLDAVLERLAASPDVEAIVLVGSTGTEKLNETSDYDVFIAVASDPPPLGLALTTVDGRVAEFVFFSMAFVERAAAEIAATTEDTWAGSIAPRFATGRLVFDRHGQFAPLMAPIRAALPLASYKTDALYGAWFKVNYNVMQTRRMARSSDPVYRAAVEYRLLREQVELWTAYCAVRGIPWRGEKSSPATAPRMIRTTSPGSGNAWERPTANGNWLSMPRSRRRRSPPWAGCGQTTSRR